MALNNYRNNPNYPDRYTRNTRWKKILPVQGRPLQTAELIEAQSIIQDNIKQGFNTLFRNGSIIKGLRISLLDIGTDTVSLLVTEGQIYIEGHILDVQESILSVPSTGLYNIDVIVEETIVDEVIDPSLRDPIKGAFSLGTPGASRLVWNTNINFSREGDFVINGYAIAQISEGVILQKELNPFYQVEKSVSQFIYEKSGNFCVEGLETSYIGFDNKISSDISKQEELQTAVQQASDEQQRALSNAIGLQTRISNLNSQLDQARINALVDSAAYQPLVARLSAELNDANLTLATYFEDLTDAGKALESANTDLKNIESLITDQQILSISPGVAYVKGQRIALNSASRLFIPQSFPTKTVENAAFTYRAETSQTLRTISSNDGSDNIRVPSGNYINLIFKFEDISNNILLTPEIPTGIFSIDFVIRMNLDNTISNIVNRAALYLNGTELLSSVSFVIRDEEQLNSPIITNKVTNLGTEPFSAEDIQNILMKYISTTRTNNTLVFKAQPNVLKARDINIIIESKLYNSNTNQEVNFDTGILINPRSGSLSQEISKSTYKLGFSPVNKITRLSSDLQVEATLIRSEAGIDPVQAEDTVLSVDRITYQENITSPVIVYTAPLDFTLTRNNIVWNLNRLDSIPPAGRSYNILYTYTDVLVPEVDYILNRDSDSIEFIGRTPKINGRFNVDYSYFLSKAGVVTLDKDGVFNFVLSAPSKNPVVPTVSEDKLAIASFIVNNKSLELQELNCRRQTVKDLYELSTDIQTNKENNEALKLDLQALNNSILTSPNKPPIGIFSTTLNNLDKLDRTLTTAALIPGIQAATNGFFNTDFGIFVPFSDNNNYLKNPTGEVEYVTIPFTERLLFRQVRATTTTNLLPKSASIKKRGNIYISEKTIFKNQGSKQTDYVLNETVVNGQVVKTTVSKDYFVLPNFTSCDPLTKQGLLFSANNSDSELVQDIQANVRNTLGSLANTISNSIQRGVPTTLNALNSNQLLEEIYRNVYTKTLELDVVIDELPLRETGINLFIDGTLVALDSTKITTGSINNRNLGINVNDKGKAAFKIRIPENILTGTHTIELFKENRVYAKTNFYVYNTLLNQLVITPVKNWNAQPVGLTSCTQIPLNKVDSFSQDLRIVGLDPSVANSEINSNLTSFNKKESEFPLRFAGLNQTFVPTQNYFLTSVNLKIKDEPRSSNNSELNVYLGTCSNDIPTKDTLAKASLDNNINTTEVQFGNEGTFTKYNFNSLPLVNRDYKYNLALENHSPSNLQEGFEVYTAVVDDLDITTNSIVGNQLYLDGDLFSSIDGISLSLLDKEDLTFELYRAEFASSHVVDLGSFSLAFTGAAASTINYFCLNTRDIIPEGTDIIYKYSIDASRSNKIPFKPNSTICLNSAVSIIYIEAELITNFKNVAPQILVKGSSVSLYSNKNNSVIVSKQTEYPEPYDEVIVTLQSIEPANTSIKVFYSPSNGFIHEGPEWIELELQEDKTFIVNNALQLYEKTYSIKESSKFYYEQIERKLFRYRVVLTGSNGQTPLVRNITSIVK